MTNTTLQFTNEVNEFNTGEWTAIPTLFPKIEQGVGDAQRIGRRINIVRDSVRMELKSKDDNTFGFYHVRLIAIMFPAFSDLQFSGAGYEAVYPDAVDVVQDTSRLRTYMDRNLRNYRKVFDKEFLMTGNPTTGATFPTEQVFTVQLPKRVLEYYHGNTTGSVLGSNTSTVKGGITKRHICWYMFAEKKCSIGVDHMVKWTD